MRFDWPDLILTVAGVLVYADTGAPLRDCGRELPRFADAVAAEAYLAAEDIRGTIR